MLFLYIRIQTLMNVPGMLMAVVMTVSTQMDLTTALVQVDMS